MGFQTGSRILEPEAGILEREKEPPLKANKKKIKIVE